MSQAAKSYVDPSEQGIFERENGQDKKEETLRYDVVGNVEFTFRGKYNYAVLPATAVDIESLLGNVVKRDQEYDKNEVDKAHQRIEALGDSTESEALATKEIEETGSPDEQIVVEDDHRVRDLFWGLANQMDVFPNQHQNRLRKLTEEGRQDVYTRFVTSFKTTDQNRMYDNVSDHWVTEQNCFVVSDDTAQQIMKTFDVLGDKGKYSYELSGEREDILILNINGIKAAFIIDARPVSAANDDVEVV